MDASRSHKDELVKAKLGGRSPFRVVWLLITAMVLGGCWSYVEPGESYVEAVELEDGRVLYVRSGMDSNSGLWIAEKDDERRKLDLEIPQEGCSQSKVVDLARIGSLPIIALSCHRLSEVTRSWYEFDVASGVLERIPGSDGVVNVIDLERERIAIVDSASGHCNQLMRWEEHDYVAIDELQVIDGGSTWVLGSDRTGQCLGPGVGWEIDYSPESNLIAFSTVGKRDDLGAPLMEEVVVW